MGKIRAFVLTDGGHLVWGEIEVFPLSSIPPPPYPPFHHIPDIPHTRIPLPRASPSVARAGISGSRPAPQVHIYTPI